MEDYNSVRIKVSEDRENFPLPLQLLKNYSSGEGKFEEEEISMQIIERLF